MLIYPLSDHPRGPFDQISYFDIFLKHIGRMIIIVGGVVLIKFNQNSRRSASTLFDENLTFELVTTDEVLSGKIILAFGSCGKKEKKHFFLFLFIFLFFK